MRKGGSASGRKISIRGEKTVKPTKRTVPVERAKESREAKKPIPGPALDHRRQITGTDALPCNARRR